MWIDRLKFFSYLDKIYVNKDICAHMKQHHIVQLSVIVEWRQIFIWQSAENDLSVIDIETSKSA